MKVLPVPRKRNLTVGDDGVSVVGQANSCRLRRLPHIFAKVLQLPFLSDADVSIDDTCHSIRFTVSTQDIIGDVSAHAVEICPGVTKIFVRGNGVVDLSGELDLWRFRLPDSCRPELVFTAYEGGELVITVPKGVGDKENGVGDMRNGTRLLLVH